MSDLDIVSEHGIFRGSHFYVQTCNRSSLSVDEDIRFLRMCGGNIVHHPLNDQVTHYIVELPMERERRNYTHKIKGGRPIPGLAKDFTLDDLVRVALSCQEQITVVQSAWVTECCEKGRILGPIEDCGGWLVKAAQASAADKDTLPQKTAEASSVAAALRTPTDAPESSTTLAPAPGYDRSRSRMLPVQEDVVLTAPSSPPTSSLFSPPLSPARSTAASTPPPIALPSLSITASTPSPVQPSFSPKSPSTGTFTLPPPSRSSEPAFLRSTSHRRRPATATKKIPNTARVRTSTVGELPEMDDRRKRRRSSTAQTPGLRNPPLSVSVPKRPRLDLSKLKFTKRSQEDPQPSFDRSRSSSPEIPLAVGAKRPSRAVSGTTSKSPPAAPSKPTRAPYPSPALTTSPTTSTLHLSGPSIPRDLFCDHDGIPLRFYLDDSSHAQMATDIIDHGGELAPEWDSTFIIRSSKRRQVSKSASKGAVTSCPLAVSVKWLKESISAGRLLPTRPYTLQT